MKRFNLSEWAITHQSLVLFMIILFGAAFTRVYAENHGHVATPAANAVPVPPTRREESLPQRSQRTQRVGTQTRAH